MIVALLKQSVRKVVYRSVDYRYSNFTIRLPSHHMLPFYQSLHATYDKFLPHLVNYLPRGSTVIDVGANCGDSLAGMVEANKTLRYICVEPDDEFFDFLRENVSRIKSAVPTASIFIFKALIGRQVTHAQLEGTGGTKHAVQKSTSRTNPVSLSSVTLDELLLPMELDNLELIKSDVDGFDFDVIDSASLLIKQHLPILFFECDFRKAHHKEGFRKTITELESCGYRLWTVFDNYGELILTATSVDVLFQLFDYIDRQSFGSTSQNIRYFDVMAGTEKHEGLFRAVSGTYLRLATGTQCDDHAVKSNHRR